MEHFLEPLSIRKSISKKFLMFLCRKGRRIRFSSHPYASKDLYLKERVVGIMQKKLKKLLDSQKV